MSADAPAPSPPPLAPPTRGPRLLVLLALAATVFFARAWLLRSAGSPVPFMDQWEAEAAQLYRPWLDGTLAWSQLFAPHNEHRLALTRLADVALFAALGGWHPWAQLLLNAALHAATAVALAALFWSALAPVARAAIAAFLAAAFAAPFGWQNALWGFQSQVYFGNLLAVAALAGLCAAPPLRRAWWLGLAAAALALFAQAGGLLVAVAALPVLLLSPPPPSRPLASPAAHAAIGLLVARFGSSGICRLVLPAVVIAIGLALRIDPPHHAALHAQNLGQFSAAFFRALSWPFVDHPWPWLALQAPLALLLLRRVRFHTPLAPVERAALALVLFSMLHAAAIAWSRGAGLPDARPLSRYQDPLLLGAAAQAFAALRLAHECARPGRLAALAWFAAVAAGLLALATTNFSLHLPFKRAQDRAALAAVRAYLASPDAGLFAHDWRAAALQPDAAVVRRLLDTPALLAVLPADLRRDTPPPWPIRQAPLLLSLAALLLSASLALSVFPRPR